MGLISGLKDKIVDSGLVDEDKMDELSDKVHHMKDKAKKINHSIKEHAKEDLAKGLKIADKVTEVAAPIVVKSAKFGASLGEKTINFASSEEG